MNKNFRTHFYFKKITFYKLYSTYSIHNTPTEKCVKLPVSHICNILFHQTQRWVIFIHKSDARKLYLEQQSILFQQRIRTSPFNNTYHISLVSHNTHRYSRSAMRSRLISKWTECTFKNELTRGWHSQILQIQSPHDFGIQ